MIAANNCHVVSLIYAPVGTPLTVADTRGGQQFQRKMAAMGIYSGEDIEVLERSSGGALIVKVKGTRLAIGHGMSSKIKVKVF